MDKQKMRQTAELIRKGGTILGEPCKVCGGVLIRYRNKIYCTVHDDISSVLKEQELTYDDVKGRLREIVLRKVEETMQLLMGEREPIKQEQLATLLLKYVELLDKVKES